MPYWLWKIFISWIPDQEWDENWKSWPHCNGQAGCWMHCTPAACAVLHLPLSLVQDREESAIMIEYALLMSDGSMQVRPTDPEIDEIYPLHKWIENQQRFTHKVYQREIDVITDWTEVPRGDQKG
jgi:hypothetical protein